MNPKELEKELAELAGLKWKLVTDGEEHLFDGDDICSPTVDNLVPFTSSLDACFKWLMPIVREKLGEKEYFKFLMHWVLHMEEGKEALALCLDAKKLMDSNNGRNDG